jgi:hypothetical protein
MKGSTLELDSGWLIFYRFSLYLWMFLGMAYISLIINLSLDYFKENADNIRKEFINIIEEKVNISIKQYQLARRMKHKARRLSKLYFLIIFLFFQRSFFQRCYFNFKVNQSLVV